MPAGRGLKVVVVVAGFAEVRDRAVDYVSICAASCLLEAGQQHLAEEKFDDVVILIDRWSPIVQLSDYLFSRFHDADH